MLLAVSGCTAPGHIAVVRVVRTPVPKAVRSKKPLPIKRSAKVLAVIYKKPQRVERPSSSVLMSWYAEGYGTASGERFSPAAATCAGASRFDLGQHLTLRNPQTGQKTQVKVNDRGAFEKWGRSLDCTPAVWKALGFPLRKGVVSVAISAK